MLRFALVDTLQQYSLRLILNLILSLNFSLLCFSLLVGKHQVT